MILFRLLAFAFGVYLVAVTVFSAVATFVVPRNAPSRITRAVFIAVRRIFFLRLKHTQDYRPRDAVMAFYAPVSLLALVPVWVMLLIAGYTLMFWSVGHTPWLNAFRAAGSSLLTLGIEPLGGFFQSVLGFSAAAIGLMLVALLIAYLPSMYGAFSRRETAVTLLEVRAGSPPSAIDMLLRYHRIHGLERLTEQWRLWEIWFADILESHTSLPALVFFRSPQPDHAWITAAGAILDAASLTQAALDIPDEPQAALCIRAGFLALRQIADFFNISHDPDPHFPASPISITRQEFDAALRQLAESGLPLKPDRDQAWQDFGGWRVNYDTVLLALCSLTMAPRAPWSSDRAPAFTVPPLYRRA